MTQTQHTELIEKHFETRDELNPSNFPEDFASGSSCNTKLT